MECRLRQTENILIVLEMYEKSHSGESGMKSAEPKLTLEMHVTYETKGKGSSHKQYALVDSVVSHKYS